MKERNDQMSYKSWYNQDADYQTNAKSYMDYLARHNKFMKVLVEDYEVFKEIMTEEFKQFQLNTDKTINQFNERLDNIKQEMIDFFNQWLADGVLDEVINQDILNSKADKEDLEEALIAFRKELHDTVDSELKIHMFDNSRFYSQDCILVQAGDKNLLIDYGLHGDALQHINKIKALGVTKIHYTYITHYHGDHYGGARRFIEESDLDFSECQAFVPPRANWDRLVNTSGTGSTAELLRSQEDDFRNMLTTHNISWSEMEDGQTIHINNDTELTFRNIGDRYWTHYYNAEFNDNIGGPNTDYNDFSVIGLLKHGKRYALLSSDLAYTAQSRNYHHIPESLMFYTIPHHSLDRVVHPEWSKRIDSDTVFISNARRDGSITSRQEYGELRDKGSSVYSTNLSGDISFIKTIEGVSVKSQKGLAYKGVNSPTLTGAKQLLRGTDLDDIVEAGTYVSDSISNTDSLINTPSEMARGGFKMVVENYHHETRRRQTIYEISGRGMIFYRVFSTNNEWNRWIRVLIDSDIYDDYDDGIVRNNIEEGTDINTLMTNGRYASRTAGVTGTLTNLPPDVETGFVIDVIMLYDENRLYQHIRCNNTLGDEYTRAYTGSWGIWCKIVKERTDQ